MAIEKHIKEITDILKREVRSFETILELLILEEKCLIKCDTVGLAEIIARQEDVFTSIACLEKSRIDALSKISIATGIDVDSLTVTTLADTVDGLVKKELVDAGHVLVRMNEDIQRKKSTNTMLINQSVMMVENDIRLVMTAINRNDSPDAGYDLNAQTSNNSKSVCLDQRM